MFPEAKAEYAAASQAFPGHPFAVMGYAKVIAADGDVGGSLELLRRHRGAPLCHPARRARKCLCVETA